MWFSEVCFCVRQDSFPEQNLKQIQKDSAAERKWKETIICVIFFYSKTEEYRKIEDFDDFKCSLYTFLLHRILTNRESSGYNEPSCFWTNGQMYGHEGWRKQILLDASPFCTIRFDVVKCQNEKRWNGEAVPVNVRMMQKQRESMKGVRKKLWKEKL